jgi:hypothetical protein
MFEFSEVLNLLAQLKQEGVVADYALAGAMAAAFWDEGIATQDLDAVVVYAKEPSTLDPLRPILDRLPQSEFPREGEHVIVAGVPVETSRANCADGRGWLGRRAVTEAIDGGRAMSDSIDRSFSKKAEWHAAQRALSPKEKVALVIKLQQREVELNKARAAAGRPVRTMKVWQVKP